MFRILLSATAVIATLFVSPLAHAQRPTDTVLVQTLRGGGHIIVLRHGATHSDQADTDPLNHDNIAQQRQLNDKGEQAAKTLGQALKAMNIPVAKAITSRFNRAYQTARLAGIANVEKSIDLTEGGLVVSPNENGRRRTAFRKLAATLPPAGANILIVSHKPNIVDAFGKDWSDISEGEATILKPDGQHYAVLARVKIDEWPRLASAKP